MRKMKSFCLVLCLLLCCSELGRTEPQQEIQTVRQVLERNLEGSERALVSAAEAMPEEKYSFTPTIGEFKGVRTFAQMAKHVAVVNFMNAAALLGEKTPVEVGEKENGPDSVKTKVEILKFLRDSFAYLRKATNTVDENNLMKLTTDPWNRKQAPLLMFITTGLSHPWEMYGQMVIYLRMNGIDPSGSH